MAGNTTLNKSVRTIPKKRDVISSEDVLILTHFIGGDAQSDVEYILRLEDINLGEHLGLSDGLGTTVRDDSGNNTHHTDINLDDRVRSQTAINISGSVDDGGQFNGEYIYYGDVVLSEEGANSLVNRPFGGAGYPFTNRHRAFVKDNGGTYDLLIKRNVPSDPAVQWAYARFTTDPRNASVGQNLSSSLSGTFRPISTQSGSNEVIPGDRFIGNSYAPAPSFALINLELSQQSISGSLLEIDPTEGIRVQASANPDLSASSNLLPTRGAVQGYSDSHIGGANSFTETPGASTNDHVIAWNNTLGRFELRADGHNLSPGQGIDNTLFNSGTVQVDLDTTGSTSFGVSSLVLSPPIAAAHGDYIDVGNVAYVTPDAINYTFRLFGMSGHPSTNRLRAYKRFGSDNNWYFLLKGTVGGLWAWGVINTGSVDPSNITNGQTIVDNTPKGYTTPQSNEAISGETTVESSVLPPPTGSPGASLTISNTQIPGNPRLELSDNGLRSQVSTNQDFSINPTYLTDRATIQANFQRSLSSGQGIDNNLFSSGRIQVDLNEGNTALVTTNLAGASGTYTYFGNRAVSGNNIFTHSQNGYTLTNAYGSWKFQNGSRWFFLAKRITGSTFNWTLYETNVDPETLASGATFTIVTSRTGLSSVPVENQGDVLQGAFYVPPTFSTTFLGVTIVISNSYLNIGDNGLSAEVSNNSDLTVDPDMLTTRNTIRLALSGASGSPSVHNMSTDIASRIGSTASLQGNHNATFSISNRNAIQTLVMNVNGIAVHTFPNPSRDGVQTAPFTIDNTEWTSILAVNSTVITFQVVATDSANGTHASNGVVVTRQDSSPNELLYVLRSATNNPGTVPIAGGESFPIEDSTTSLSFTTPTGSDNDFLIILAPANKDIQTLVNENTNANVLSFYNKTDNVRTIATEQYDAYVFNSQIVAGATFNYSATFNII